MGIYDELLKRESSVVRSHPEELATMGFGPANGFRNLLHHRPIQRFGFASIRLSALPFSCLLGARFKMTKLDFPPSEAFP